MHPTKLVELFKKQYNGMVSDKFFSPKTLRERRVQEYHIAMMIDNEKKGHRIVFVTCSLLLRKFFEQFLRIEFPVRNHYRRSRDTSRIRA